MGKQVSDSAKGRQLPYSQCHCDRQSASVAHDLASGMARTTLKRALNRKNTAEAFLCTVVPMPVDRSIPMRVYARARLNRAPYNSMFACVRACVPTALSVPEGEAAASVLSEGLATPKPDSRTL